MDDRAISAHHLRSGQSLSFDQQPYFARLIAEIRRSQRELVLIVGAGVSMDAGLPSWAGLLSRLETELIPPDRRKAFDILNKEDLERRTDKILFLTGNTSLNKSNFKYLKKALYSDASSPEPGLLALAVMRLAASYSPRVSLITTNFDQVLELAFGQVFGEECSSYSFDSWDSWASGDTETHRRSIMHLHGSLYVDDTPALTPLVLSESDFRESGASIQEKLRGLLQGKLVVVIGASLADRNIAAPLAAMSDDGLKFTLACPTLSHEDLDPEECSEVAVWEADVIKEALHVRAILLKSYSQVTQTVTELALAASAPSRYRRPGGSLKVGESLHYGTRFRRELEKAYSSVGASSKTGNMNDWDSLALSQILNEATFARGGPNYVLSRLRQKYSGSCAPNENIGLFIWLRDLPKRPKSVYGLRLLASSAYAHWNSWSAFRVEPITSDSKNAAVQAAFRGQPVFLDVRATGHSGRWRGAYAVPLIVAASVVDTKVGEHPLDQLILGAIAVNTDCFVSQAPTVPSGQLSVLALLKPDEIEYFSESVTRAVAELFG